MTSMSLSSFEFNRSEAKQWAKAIFYCCLLSTFMMFAHATDATGIGDLDKQATAFQTGVRMFAKWGGILVIVVCGVVLASGKAEGQVAKLLFGAALGIGVIAAAWGWFNSNFSEGFAF